METNSGFTLTQMSYYGRQVVKFGAILLVTLIVGRTFWSAASSYWKATHPPAPPPPTVGFGILPPLNFPDQTAKDKPSSYQLQTANGGLPSFGDRAKVFFMPKSSASLLADQKVKQIASSFGFVFTPTTLNDRTYRWNKTQPIQATLDMDLWNNTFSLTTNYLSRPELLSNLNLPSDSEAITTVKSYISSGMAMPPDLAVATGSATYLKAVGTDVVPAISFSDAEILQVDLNRFPVDNTFLFYTPTGIKGIVHAVLSGGLKGKDQIVEMEYKYHAIDYNTVYTYPIRSAGAAWQILQSGAGYIAQKGTQDAAVIRDVSLGYYDDTEEQSYMQPVYVFQGDNGFIGFVPAVDPRWIQQGASVAKQ